MQHSRAQLMQIKQIANLRTLLFGHLLITPLEIIPPRSQIPLLLRPLALVGGGLWWRRRAAWSAARHGLDGLRHQATASTGGRVVRGDRGEIGLGRVGVLRCCVGGGGGGAKVRGEVGRARSSRLVQYSKV